MHEPAGRPRDMPPLRAGRSKVPNPRLLHRAQGGARQEPQVPVPAHQGPRRPQARDQDQRLPRPGPPR